MRANCWGGFQRGYGHGITRTLRTWRAILLRAHNVLPEHLSHAGTGWDTQPLSQGPDRLRSQWPSGQAAPSFSQVCGD